MVDITNRIGEAERLKSLNRLSCEVKYTEINDPTRRTSEVILDNYRVLRRLIECKEEALRERWTKKSNAQRRKIFQDCGIKLSETHRADYKQLLRWQVNPDTDPISAIQLTSEILSHRNDFLHPHLNVEDLTKVKSMLLLINSRGRNPPHLFANADLRAADLGVVNGFLSLQFLKDHTLLLEGESAETYGRLVRWTDKKMKERILAGFQHLPHEGLLILEIQYNLYLFLVNWCQALLQDIEIATIWRLPTEPEPPLLVKTSDNTTIASIAMETPYRLPSKLDFNRLRAVVTAKRLGAEDYIHDLREDPGIFADAMMEASDHRVERVLDDEGKAGSSIGTPGFWEDVTRCVVADAYSDIISWDIISKQLERLAMLQGKYAAFIHPQNGLPEEFLKELLSFKKVLKFIQTGPRNNLTQGLPASLPFRHKFHRLSGISGCGEATQRVGRGFSKSEDLMIHLFEIIFTPGKQKAISLPAIMDEIEHMIEQDLELKAKITPWVSRLLSNLGLIVRLGHELDLYLPWATGFPMDMETHKDWLRNNLRDRCSVLHKTEHYITFAFESLKGLGDPTDGRYRYPCDQRRTKKITEAIQSAEGKLDYFWTKLDFEYRRVSRNALNKSVGHIFTKIRTIERTPDWIAPTRPARVFPKSFQAPTIPQFSPNEPITSFVAPREKIKPKTRGEPTSYASIVEDTLEVLPSKPKERIYKLKARALKVFKVLFFQPSESNIPGGLPWTEFKYAMVAMGFSVHKLDGSACQFTPPSTDEYGGKHGIQFHEPHSPGSTARISFHVARSMGRRLNYTYGWHGGMFVSE
ncbi:hypothetical protein BPAE_0079g00430 [Botrytis paeoniae]|uniref:Uncharacterized protein n=1 Tax=Botrytis paeoniae TaxID=278948 RepID=A0A4Z1FLV6_9HELO|nr:hypothetical protein BPAE_0079g00430 [Botrytis paeoniae]